MSLVIRQTQQVHDEIADLLEQLRRLQDLQVTIEVRFVTVSDRFFERIGSTSTSTSMTTWETALCRRRSANRLLRQARGQHRHRGNSGHHRSAGGATGQQGQQAQAGGGANGFQQGPRRDLVNRNEFPKYGTVTGLLPDGSFPERPRHSVPTRFVPDRRAEIRGIPGGRGLTVGLAILSDLEAFFLISAAQGDERNNLLFAPKVTLFNGQLATVQSVVQRPFVTSLIPTVGFFSVGFQPQITVLSEGVTMSVQAVISADRRYVRLTVVPSFTAITDVQTFSFVGGVAVNRANKVNKASKGARSAVSKGSAARGPAVPPGSAATRGSAGSAAWARVANRVRTAKGACWARKGRGRGNR